MLSIDNMQIINRCAHGADVLRDMGLVAQVFTEEKLQGLAGEAAISRSMGTLLVEKLRQRPAQALTGMRPVRSNLTAREWEVLDLLCERKTTDQIASELYLSSETVRSHVKAILRKLGVNSREDAVAIANRMRSSS